MNDKRNEILEAITTRNDEDTDAVLDMDFRRIENGSIHVCISLGKTRSFYLPYALYAGQWLHESLELLHSALPDRIGCPRVVTHTD